MNKQQKEVQQAFLDNEKEVLDALKVNYNNALIEINSNIEALLARQDADMQYVIYQAEYQKALRKQVEGALDILNGNNFETVSDYLTASYEEGFIGTMYDLQSQGVPLIFPINQAQVIQAIKQDTKLSSNLYEAFDMNDLKKKITSEISRGISSAMTYNDIARNISGFANINLNNAMRIARTEGHRINIKSSMDAQKRAKEKGADIVKQWDASLDSKTRPHHRELDGQIRELDEDFTYSGGSVSAPSYFGIPSEDINCRCALLQRARWALGDDITKYSPDAVEEISDDGVTKLFKIKAKDYEDFKKGYWSDGNIKYMKFVSDMEKKYKTSNFKIILDSMTEKEYVNYRSILSENPLLTVLTKKTEIETSKNESGSIISKITDKLLNTKIVHNEVKKMAENISVDAIIEKVGGGDMTDGSCTSLSLAYIGNRMGYDVLDFRGGESCDFFSKTGNIIELANLSGVKKSIVEEYSDIKGTISLLKSVEKEKEYILSTGEHTAIIRKSLKGIEYLELQSPTDNGFKNLTTQKLIDRFGCKKSHSAFGIKTKEKSILIDAESLYNNDEFKHILGYINTSGNAQMKGSNGVIK